MEFIGLTLVLGLAGILLFWSLDETYLWQDEAATAVLSLRTMKYGRPLAYDGVNLITIDNADAEDLGSVDQRSRDPKAAVDYYVQRGDFKADTAWRYQPWGQFIFAGVSLKLLGQTTFAARLPFSIAAFLTVVLLYWFVRRYYDSSWMALSASLLLVLNAYWILHSRQCRYYSLSSFFMLLTLVSYARWQWSRQRWSAALFVAVSWMWFQVDYGTFWPVLGVLFLDALSSQRGQRLREALLTGSALLATIAPFAYYYELWDRLSFRSVTWGERFHSNLFLLNQYVVSGVVLVAATTLVIRRWGKGSESERRLVMVGCLIVAAIVLWVPSVAPDSFVRYIVPVMPVGAWLTAWTVHRAFNGRSAFAIATTILIALTPALSSPMHSIEATPKWVTPDSWIRPELSLLASEIFTGRRDPNRIVVEWLRQNSSPEDEILVNYEDVPLMFYLPNPIRGGISAFRAEDESTGPPRFLVIRRSVPFVHWPVFEREASRYRWTEIDTQAPDIPWGNNPDPMGQMYGFAGRPLLLARRMDEHKP